jgi:hypothetical protein
MKTFGDGMVVVRGEDHTILHCALGNFIVNSHSRAPHKPAFEGSGLSMATFDELVHGYRTLTDPTMSVTRRLEDLATLVLVGAIITHGLRATLVS